VLIRATSGADSQPSATRRRRASLTSNSSDDVHLHRSRPPSVVPSDAEEIDATKSGPARAPGSWSLDTSLLLASGSSDPHVLIYDLTPLPATSLDGQAHLANGGLVQTLEGHKGEVYSVAFLQPGGEYGGQGMLASSGADEMVKLWRPRRR
jgi:WD40 repeat protein